MSVAASFVPLGDHPGLTSTEVRERTAAGLANVAPPGPGRTLPQILRANLLTRFNAILGSLLVVVAFVGPPQDALFGVVLTSNVAIGIFQEVRTKRTLDRLAILTAPSARVVRDGSPGTVAVEELVLDDLVVLEAGDQVGADAVVLASAGLELDESLLTGEAEPVEKAAGDTVHAGSFVTAGRGNVTVTGVGADAYAVRLEAEARQFSLVRSELQQGTNWILRLVTWVMVPTGALLVVNELLRSHQSLPDALRGSVAGVGAMVPEGLVLLTSIAFAVGALRLARRRVLVQELAAIEGLARVDVLCIDKTGTLTEPGVSLEAVEPLVGQSPDELEEVVAALAASDPAPNATMSAVRARYPDAEPWPLETVVPFSSARKWSALGFTGRGLWVLGAPGIVAPSLPPEAEERLAAHERSGERVVLLARALAAIPADGQPALPALEPVGLLVFGERVRPDAPETVRYLLAQGIEIKVLSGDSPVTVASVAARVGIPLGRAAADATGLGADEAAIGAALDTGNVVGRVRPDQKLAAVRSLQARGRIVAMVGDGVNDVGALKQADLGIAMGSGSQSARSVARIILLDSAFSVVPRVLGEGRRVIANIERVGNLFVTKTVYAALLGVVVAVSGVPFPFFPRHLTIVTTFTIGVPGFFLALATSAPRASPGFARRVLRFAVPAGLVSGVCAFAVYALARAAPGASAEEARTAATLALLAVGLVVLGLISRPLDPVRLGLLVLMAGGAALAMLVPFFRRVFGLAIPAPTTLLEEVLVVGVAVVALVTGVRLAPLVVRALARRRRPAR